MYGTRRYSVPALVVLSILLLTGCAKWVITGEKPVETQLLEPTMGDREFYIAYQVTYEPPSTSIDAPGQPFKPTELCAANGNIFVKRSFISAGLTHFSCSRYRLSDALDTPSFGFTYNSSATPPPCGTMDPANTVFVTPYIRYENELDCSMRTRFSSTLEVEMNKDIPGTITEILPLVGSNTATVTLLSQAVGGASLNNLVAELGRLTYVDDAGAYTVSVIDKSRKAYAKFAIPLFFVDKNDTASPPRPSGKLVFTPIIKKSLFTESSMPDGRPRYAAPVIPAIESLDGKKILSSYLDDQRAAMKNISDSAGFNGQLQQVRGEIDRNYRLSRYDAAYCVYYVASAHENFMQPAFVNGAGMSGLVDDLRGCGVSVGGSCNFSAPLQTSWEPIEAFLHDFLRLLRAGHEDTTAQIRDAYLAENVTCYGPQAFPAGCSLRQAVAGAMQTLSGRYGFYMAGNARTYNAKLLFLDDGSVLYLMQLGLGTDGRASYFNLSKASADDLVPFVGKYPERRDEIKEWAQAAGLSIPE